MRRPGAVVNLLLFIAVAAVVLRLGVGPSGLGFPDSREAFTLRAERALCGVLVGGALAVGGVLLQTLLRNPLASPDLIGPASGAGFAVMLAEYVTHSAGVGFGAVALTSVHTGAAVIGSLGAITIVYAFSQRRGAIEPVQLILIGVVTSIMLGAGTMFLLYLMPDRGQSIGRWTIGALSDDAPRIALAAGAVLVILGVAGGLAWHKHLDAASLQDDEAAAVGVPVRALRLGLFLGAGLLTAIAVVLAGPVGFVGLISPHIVRSIAGPAHRVVIPGSALCGAAIILIADAVTRLVDLGGGRMPIGVFTAALGGVVFIGMVRSPKLPGDHG